jgi:hypothetical protein
MPLSAEQIAQQCDLELELLRGEITLAELVDRSAALEIPVADYLLEPALARRYQHQPITITVEQLEKRDRWEQMLMRGEVTLDDALAMQMGIGVPIGDYTRQRYASAVDACKNGDFKDLAEPFGIAMSKTNKNAEARHTRIANIRFHVDAEAEKGLPKTDPSQYPGTAFEAAGELLDMAPSYIFELYYRKK